MKKIIFLFVIGLMSIQTYASCFKLMEEKSPTSIFRNDCGFNIFPAVCIVGHNCGGYGKKEYLVNGVAPTHYMKDFRSHAAFSARRTERYKPGTYLRYSDIDGRNFLYGYCKAPKKMNKRGKCSRGSRR